MYAETHGVLTDLDNMERNVAHMRLGDAHQGKADLEFFSKELVMVMLVCVAIDHAMHKLFSLN